MWRESCFCTSQSGRNVQDVYVCKRIEDVTWQPGQSIVAQDSVAWSNPGEILNDSTVFVGLYFY